MYRRKSKTKIKEDTIHLGGFPAEVTVTEISRRRYNKSNWNGYGITFTVELEDQDDFTYRETIQKQKLNPSRLTLFVDNIFNRSRPTSISDFIINASQTAEQKLDSELEIKEVSTETKVESALVAIE